MNNFETTSQFVGILLNKSIFFDLSIQLSNYLKDNNLEDGIILQDINSIHLSLYYLDSNPPKKASDLLNQIRKDLEGLELNIASFNYFYENQQERIAYFESNNIERLKKANQIFRLNLPNNVLENSYNFIPHITIFSIKDYPSFKKNKKNLEEILSSFIEKIKEKNVFKSVNIFQVDSTKEPEVQLIVV